MVQSRRALFVMPSFTGRSASIDARWIAAAQLAAAVGRRIGQADVLTPYGVREPDEVEAWAVRAEAQRPSLAGIAQRLPRPVRLILGDLRDWRRASSFRRVAGQVGKSYSLVVQFHRRFQDSGVMLARRLSVPSVMRVEALEVREQAAWGIRRMGWGRVVEKLGELRPILQADLVAPVSAALDAQLAELGVPADRRVVIPNGVDLERFSPGAADAELRRHLGLEGRFVVGWVGGFRPFHGLELLPDIARVLRQRVPGASLCLIGTGPLWGDVARHLRDFADIVHMPGAVPHGDIPRWIRMFDACLLLASDGPFHYSPLKLFEYLGCGRPVVAAAAGDVATILTPDRDALVVPRAAPTAIVDAVERLARNQPLRSRLGSAGRATAELSGSWDARASMLIDALETRGLLEMVRNRS